MGLISRVSSRTYRTAMFRTTLLRFGKKAGEVKVGKKRGRPPKNPPAAAPEPVVIKTAPATPAVAGLDTLGFPESREAFTTLKKSEPLSNYASWDTQRYVNKGVCFYDLIDKSKHDRLERDVSLRKIGRNEEKFQTEVSIDNTAGGLRS